LIFSRIPKGKAHAATFFGDDSSLDHRISSYKLTATDILSVRQKIKFSNPDKHHILLIKCSVILY